MRKCSNKTFVLDTFTNAAYIYKELNNYFKILYK